MATTGILTAAPNTQQPTTSSQQNTFQLKAHLSAASQYSSSKENLTTNHHYSRAGPPSPALIETPAFSSAPGSVSPALSSSSQLATPVARYEHPHSPNRALFTATSNSTAAPSPRGSPPGSALASGSCASPVLTHAHGHGQHSPPGAYPFPSASASVSASGFANHSSAPTAAQAQSTNVSSRIQHHYQRPMVAAAAAEPTMSQLLEQMPSSMSSYQRPTNYDRDATMANATGVVSWRKGQGFKEWEKVRLNSPEVRRKADVCQLCEQLLISVSLKTGKQQC